MAGPEVMMRQRGGPHLNPIKSRAQLLDGKPIQALLTHHANVIDTAVQALSEGEQIGICGRQVLAYSADRLREIAEALA
jgi:hypothetical protein